VFAPLRREDPIPLYYQVYRSLLRGISSGQFSTSDQLPPEDELAKAFGVSKITIRNGLKMLQDEGIVQRMPGRGTFVHRRDLKYIRETSSLLGFDEEIRKAGHQPHSRELEKRLISPSKALRRRLAVPSGADVLLLKRLRSVDSLPMGVQTAYLPIQRFRGLDRFDFSTHSLYRVLAQEYRVVLSTAKQSYRIAHPDATVAALLEIKTTDPGFFAERLTFDAEGQPVEFVETFFRGDRFSVHITLVRGQDDGGFDGDI
jgi:GntR family transcriptional regulator